MTQPPPPPDDAWPTADDPTVISQRETVAGPPPPVGPPPDRRIGAGLLLGLGAVALVAVGILLAYLLTHRHKHHSTTTTVTTTPLTTALAAKVTVPRFVGMKEADALVRLGQLGLQPKEVFKTQRSPGVVLSQAPQQAAQVAKGSTVTLVVSKAPSTTTPTTTGATTTATTTGATTTDATTTGATTTGATTTTAGTTTTAAPPPPTTATMPDVSGQNEAAAAQGMNRVGILASLFFVPSSDPLGMVERQAKPSGATVPYHSHVQINISKGPNATTDEQVPNVVGKTLTDAVSTVNGAHLRLIYVKLPVTSKSQAGKIVQQSPLGGGQAPQNAQVLVYLGAYRVS